MPQTRPDDTDIDELTEFDKEFLGTTVMYLVFPLRGTRGDLSFWVRRTQELCGRLDELLRHEGAHWPFGKVMRQARYDVQGYQRDIKHHYELEGLTWRMGRQLNSVRGRSDALVTSDQLQWPRRKDSAKGSPAG